MKIVFLERGTLGEDVNTAEFEKIGDTVYYDLSDPEKNAERSKGADILVLNKIPVNASLLDGNDTVKLVCLTATGTNNVDFDYCSSRGIKVMNVAGYSTYSVAQHTFAMYFYVAEKLRAYDDYVKSGSYIQSETFSYFYYPFNELLGKKWGIVGLGNIGRRVAEIAESFGCEVIYYSASGNKYDCKYRNVSLDELLEESDIISLHCPLTKKTEKLVDEAFLRKMKKSAILLNLARGAVIDEEALYNALTQEEIAAAALDVLVKEPMLETNPLYKIKDSSKLLITPHIGWGTIEARQRCADEVLKNIYRFLEE